MTDAELVTRILSGEERLFAEIVERYDGYVWTTCLSYIRNRTDCEDVVQEIFVQCYQRLDSLRDRVAFGAWLGRMARRYCIDWLRKKSRREAALSRYGEHIDAMRPPESENAHGELESEEILEAVRTMIGTLPAKYQEALLLRYCQGYSSVAAAKYLGILAAAMRKRLELGRKKLRANAAGRSDAPTH
ncbi:RNA polymerase sigma factor [Candidatus Hydrogenedentota bacterium]